MYRTKQVVTLLIILLSLFLPSSTNAEDPSPAVEKKRVTIGRVELEQAEYPLDHYKLEADVDDGLKATGDRALHSINSGLWGFNKVIASFTLYAVGQLMSFDLISIIVQNAGEMSERIYELMAGTFLSLFVIIVGGTAAYRYYVNQQSGHAIKAILGALVIMVFTFWFYEDTTKNIAQLNEWGSDLEGIASSANVLITTENFDSSNSYNPGEGTAILKNQLFNLMVKRPYLLVNYGTTKDTEVNKEDPNRVDNLLKLKPYSEEGKEQRGIIVKDEVRTFENKQMSPDYSGERFGYLIITIISTFALAIPVMLLASFKFLLQVWFLALVIFTAIPLIISLIPSYSETALNHFKKIIGVLLMKGGLVLLTAVITGMATLVYESVKISGGIEGYAFVVFLIVLIIWGMMKYRSEIFEVASGGMVQGQRAAERMTFSIANGIQSISEKGYGRAKRLTSGGLKSADHKREGSNTEGHDSAGKVTPISNNVRSNHPSPKRQAKNNQRSTAPSTPGSRRSYVMQQNAGKKEVVSLNAYKSDKTDDQIEQKSASKPVSQNENTMVSESRNPRTYPPQRSSTQTRSSYREPNNEKETKAIKHITRYEAQRQIDARKPQKQEQVMRQERK
jgi:hypothetical protein